LCNSGAEANENGFEACQLCDRRKKVIASRKRFMEEHQVAVAATDNPKMSRHLTANHEIEFLPFNDLNQWKKKLIRMWLLSSSKEFKV